MSDSENKRRLRAAGLRATRQRVALAGFIFRDDDRHVTAEGLHAEAKAASVRVSLATVYNALHQFTSAGLLREIVVDPRRIYFDTNTRHHHHFYFEDDGVLEDIPAERIRLTDIPAPPAGAELRGVDVVVRVARSASG